MNIGKDLFDIIGVLIGFVAVMLLLSLLVTGLVQSVQALLRTRARNLRKGIEELIRIVAEKKDDSKKLAGDILNSNSFLVLGKQKNPNSYLSRAIGSPVSYIDSSKLPEAVHAAFMEAAPKQRDAGEIESESSQISEKMSKNWPLLERQLEKQFIKYIRIITIVCALVVAFSFQVSAPDVLNRLAIDPDLRSKIVSEAMTIYEGGGEKAGLVPAYRDVSEQALIEVEKKYPDLEKCEKIEQFSGSGKTRYDILEEFGEVLESLRSDIPNLDINEVGNYFKEQLDNFYQEEEAQNKKQMRAALDTLSKFNIGFWPDGWTFYKDKRGIQWQNIIGVLVTVVLLSFGAPFWYERLKDVVKLKDALSKGIKKEDEKKGNT